MEPNNDIKQQNMEKLSQNNEKMANLEKELSQIEERIATIKAKNTENKINEKKSNEEIDAMYQKILTLYEEYNKNLRDRVNKNYIEIFDDVAGRLVDSEIQLRELLDKKYELTSILEEFEKTKILDDERDKKINEDIENLKGEYEFLTNNYNEITTENLKLQKELTQHNNLLSEKNKKLNDYKIILGKLTEVRVILNKYFSSHFENFTKEEKKIIEDVNNYRINNEEEKYQRAMRELLKKNEENELKSSKSSKKQSKHSSKRESKTKLINNNQNVTEKKSEISEKEKKSEISNQNNNEKSQEKQSDNINIENNIENNNENNEKSDGQIDLVKNNEQSEKSLDQQQKTENNNQQQEEAFVDEEEKDENNNNKKE